MTLTAIGTSSRGSLVRVDDTTTSGSLTARPVSGGDCANAHTVVHTNANGRSSRRSMGRSEVELRRMELIAVHETTQPTRRAKRPAVTLVELALLSALLRTRSLEICRVMSAVRLARATTAAIALRE